MKKLTKEDKQFAYEFLLDREGYHHHKEQMAYIGFLVQTAFFTAIMTLNPDSSSPGTSNVTPELMLFLAVPFWALIHVFLRWQLRLRRYAALQVATLLSALLQNLKQRTEETTENVNPQGNAINSRSESRLQKCGLSLVDRFLWPCSSAFPYADIDLSEYPDWYQKGFKSKAAKGTGAFTGEYLVTLGSWLILVGIIVKLTLSL